MGAGMPEESKRWRTTKRQDRDFPDFLWIEKDNWRGFLKKRYEDLLLIAENEKAWFDRAIRIFNRTPNRVYEVPFPFGDDIIYVVIKAFGWREKFHYWLSPFMKSKAFNSLFTALTLERNGLLTPKPLKDVKIRLLGKTSISPSPLENSSHCAMSSESLKTNPFLID